MKYLLDIDGTVLNGGKEINESAAFIRQLQLEKKDFLLATNSIKSSSLQKKRLAEAGIAVEESRIFTPASAINSYLEQQNIRRVFIAGGPQEIEQIRADQDIEHPELIILMDFEKINGHYRDLQIIFRMMNEGCPAVSASGSLFYLRDGEKQLDTGSFKVLLETASSRSIPVLGKPSELYFAQGASLLASSPGDILVVGDDWKTDINGAKQAGMKTCLIRSGKYKRGDEYKCHPDSVIESFSDIL